VKADLESIVVKHKGRLRLRPKKL